MSHWRHSFARNLFTPGRAFAPKFAALGFFAVVLAIAASSPLAAEPAPKDGKAKVGGVTLSAQGLLMKRDASDDLVWLSDRNGTSNPIDDTPLSTSDGLHDEFNGGALVGIEGQGWQIGGFWINEYHDSQTVLGDNNLTLFEFFAPGTPDTDAFDDAYEARADYRSQVWGVEANATRQVGTMVKTLVGLRYVDLKEKFQIFYNDPNMGDQIGTIDADARNQMVGIQAGAEVSVPVASFLTLDAFGKVGAMANRVGTDVSYADDVIDGGPQPPFALDVDGTVGVFLAEAGLGASVNLTEDISLTLGYRGLYLDGVALAPGAINVVNGIYDKNHIEDANNYSLWHGGHAGLKFRM
jgi:opacity protein-like surface antigen